MAPDIEGPGDGRLAVETLLPRASEILSIGGPGHEFEIDGVNYPPKKNYDPDEAGRWRIEVSPSEPALRDYFLHVLSTSEARSREWPSVSVTEDEETVTVTVSDHDIEVRLAKTGRLAPKIGSR